MRCFILSCLLFLRRSDAGELSGVVKKLTKYFDPLSPAAHVTDVKTGIYFEHLYGVNDKANLFTADFYLTYQWLDSRWKSANWSDYIHHGLAETAVSTCDAGQHRRLADKHGSSQGSSHVNHFLEFGHDELGLVWQPDMHLRNLYMSNLRLQSEMMRVYEDGTFELSQFVWAVLSMEEPKYHVYPFDSQKLSVMVESLSHTIKRIDMHPLHELTGLEESLTEHWPGWKFNSFREDRYLVAPDYVHANPCRSEQKARIKLVIDVSRKFKPTSLVVVTLLVITSWAGFFIRIQALMPRVATGFISYLTINNIAQSRMAAIPQVNYDVWMSVFLDICRYSVFLSVLETVAAQYIADKISIRLAMILDRWARSVLPIDFVVVIVILIFTQTDDGVHTIAILSMVNIVGVIVVTAIYLVVQHLQLVKLLELDPLTVYGDGHPPLDFNECRRIFRALNKHYDGNSVVSVVEIVEWFLRRPPFKDEQHFHENALIIKKRLSQKIGDAPLTLELFLQHQRLIFIELRQWNQSEMVTIQKSKSSVIEGDKIEVRPAPAADVGMPARDQPTVVTDIGNGAREEDLEEEDYDDEDTAV